jgi:hypothetical protein
MILHIHGYNQHHDNLAFRILSKEIRGSGERAVIMPFIDYQRMPPKDIMNILLEIYDSKRIPDVTDGLTSNGGAERIELLIGYSLGGFFAYCLKSIVDAPVLLINPCLAPFMYIYKWAGGDFAREHELGYIDMLKQYLYKAETARLKTLIGDRDDYIDHSFTKRVIPPENINMADMDHNLSLDSHCIQTLERVIYELITQMDGGAAS